MKSTSVYVKTTFLNAKPRTASTLSEILVSLAVMSVGVVSLMSIFPVSVLRSAQANKLTNATNLRYNVEAMLDAQPRLFSIGDRWEISKPYSQFQLVTPTAVTSLKSPAVVFECTQAGTSASFEPPWKFQDGAVTDDGTVKWTTHLLQNYVVDPLGSVNSVLDQNYRTTANGNFFGNNGTAASTRIRAFSGFNTTTIDEATADNIATLPDSWTNIGESNQVSYTSSTTAGITTSTLTFAFPSGTVVPAALVGIPQARVLLFDESGKVTFSLPTTSSTTITWNGPALPTGFTPVRARLEAKDRRYTWMLSVRKAFSGAALMDVVVFFKRPFSPKDEQVYIANFTATIDPGFDGAPGIVSFDDDNANGVDDPGELGWVGTDDVPRNWAIIQYQSTQDKPFIKKGGFVTDADNLRWYRITDFFEDTTIQNVLGKAGLDSTKYPADVVPLTAPNDRAVFIRLDTPVIARGTTAIFMRGIVDVYPIRTHLTWEN